MDLCREFELKEIAKRLQDVLSLTEEQVFNYLLRYTARGLVCSDNGVWYVTGKGEALLWHYHELKMSLGLEDSQPAQDSKIPEIPNHRSS